MLDVALVAGEGLAADGTTETTVQRSGLRPEEPRPAVSNARAWLLFVSTERGATELVTHDVLVLGKAMGDREGCFERIGSWHVPMYSDASKWIEKAKRREIVIV